MTPTGIHRNENIPNKGNGKGCRVEKEKENSIDGQSKGFIRRVIDIEAEKSGEIQ